MTHQKIKANFECKKCGKRISYKLTYNSSNFRKKINIIQEKKGCPFCKEKGADVFINVSNDPIIE